MPRRQIIDAPRAAGGGLLDRRALFEGAFAAGALAAGSANAEPLTVADWSKTPGGPFTAYGQPSRFEDKAKRVWATPANPATPGIGASRTPHQFLDGMITPNSLQFERMHGGVPDIDPEQHRLAIHGMVKRPLVFTMDSLSRYPMTSRIAFIECGGNGGALSQPAAQTVDAQAIRGLVSCAEWTGVPLSILLDEAGVDPAAAFVFAEGADSAGMSRSIPIKKAFDDALVCLYQNGERIRPGNGYPVRLLVPGFEGNMNVKWLRRLKLVPAPVQTKDETSKYTVLLDSGKTWQFVWPIEVNSFIARPSPGVPLRGPGFYEISGLAWSGAGRIRGVEVSADGGKSWVPAALQDPVLPKALTRFRIPWQWDGGPALLQSRSTDEAGNVQPSRAAMVAERGLRGQFHVNCQLTWAIDANGEASNVYV